MMNCYILPLYIQYKLILDIVVTNPLVFQHETKSFIVLYILSKYEALVTFLLKSDKIYSPYKAKWWIPRLTLKAYTISFYALNYISAF